MMLFYYVKFPNLNQNCDISSILSRILCASFQYDGIFFASDGYFTQPWMSRAYDPCTERYAKIYYNHPEVQRALHANVTGIRYPWDTCRSATTSNSYS